MKLSELEAGSTIVEKLDIALQPYKWDMPNGAVIWAPSSIYLDADIGNDCMIGAFTNICGPVKIGSRTRIQGFCYIPPFVEVGNDVFVGPNVTFTNVKWPAVRKDGEGRPGYFKTVIEDKVSIGAGAVILPGITIGRCAVIGAGSVVTGDVEPEWLVRGNPARHIRRLP